MADHMRPLRWTYESSIDKIVKLALYVGVEGLI